MKILFCWQNYRYFPYERMLAGRELEALFGGPANISAEGISVEGTHGWAAHANRTTYFREAIAENGRRLVPLQAVLEASANGAVEEGLPGIPLIPTARRQSTRYSAHGLHEYRGKFNPQIVRAIGNLLGLKPRNWILDPFCGSGTTLLEAAHMGWNAIGVDVNPLAVEISRAKLAAVRLQPDRLKMAADELRRGLSGRVAGMTFHVALSREQMRKLGGDGWQSRLPNFDYLQAWFTESVLVQLAVILSAIDTLSIPEARPIFRVVLSDILRDVSLQDPDDLRIRRRKDPQENAAAVSLFLKTVTARLKTILDAYPFLAVPKGQQDALLWDIRSAGGLTKAVLPKGHFDAAITSPPYVTALPYIDTQRLSLALLGLIDSAQIRAAEKRLIGNREISDQERRQMEAAIRENADNLPQECLLLCRRMMQAAEKGQDGFRRLNMPALTYQYCRDMSLMFEQVRCLLKPRARFVMVVGCNKTRLGDQEFIIDTPNLLASLAQQRGFATEERIKLDTYQRFDVHRANSIRSETMIILQAT